MICRILRVFLFAFVAAFAAAALAQDPGQVPQSAEYHRLSQELEKLSVKNAWSGVERTYVALVRTGVDPKFEDHLAGAHAARALGDVASLRDRLIAASKSRESREVLDWLWGIDQGYGRVFVACDAKNARLLTPESMPFNPDERLAVEYAMSRVAEQRVFDGYLPKGRYFFGEDVPVDVMPQVQSVRIDLRSSDSRSRADAEARTAPAPLSKAVLKRRVREEKAAKKEQEKALKRAREEAARSGS